MIKLTDQEYQQFLDLILTSSGLFFAENRRYFVEKRVAKCIKESSFMSAKDYYLSLKFGNNQKDLQHLIETLTINETYFYRQIPQLESFAEEALPNLIKAQREKNDYNITLWSAACSTGPEIYTLAILIKEFLSDFSKWNIDLLATDIDRKVIETAKIGLYDKRAIKDLPAPMLTKYFKQLPDEHYQLDQQIISMVNFKHLNLVDRDAMQQQRTKDVIFCRNILIYFNSDVKRQVMHSFYNSLKKDGLLFLGHSEFMGGISAAFKLKKFTKVLAYQK